MSNEGEGPALTWVREYNAQLISQDELIKRIVNHEFKERKGASEPETVTRAMDYKDDKYQPGTFDDIYRARAYGLLTKGDMTAILEKVQERETSDTKKAVVATCQSAESAKDAPVVTLKALAEPQLVKVDDRYITVQVTLA